MLVAIRKCLVRLCAFVSVSQRFCACLKLSVLRILLLLLAYMAVAGHEQHNHHDHARRMLDMAKVGAVCN